MDVRLAWWFGIYFSGLTPLVVLALLNECSILTAALFPLPLGFILAPFVNLLPDFLGKVLVFPLFLAGFAFYGFHLYAVLKATTRRRFDFLLLILVIVVFANQLLMASMATSIRV